jgi:hypothetical protein
MPLEIKELYIRVTVNQPKQETTGDKKDAASVHADQDDLVRHCVDEMLSIIKNKKER